jgi:hypothetical protein
MNSRTKPDSQTASFTTTAGPLSMGRASASNPTQLDPEEALKQSNAAPFFQCQVAILLGGKAFFVSKTGYKGMSPEATKVADELVVFAGMRLPAVVRKERNSYVYIGPAYAHGIMDGEAWEERSALLEEFTII